MKSGFTRIDTIHEGAVGVVQPHGSVSSLVREEDPPHWDELAGQLSEGRLRSVVVDFADVPYFGARMLEALRVLGHHVQQVGGEMVLCNVSGMAREVLRVSQFETRWSIYASREEALRQLSRA